MVIVDDLAGDIEVGSHQQEQEYQLASTIDEKKSSVVDIAWIDTCFSVGKKRILHNCWGKV